MTRIGRSDQGSQQGAPPVVICRRERQDFA